MQPEVNPNQERIKKRDLAIETAVILNGRVLDLRLSGHRRYSEILPQSEGWAGLIDGVEVQARSPVA